MYGDGTVLAAPYVDRQCWPVSGPFSRLYRDPPICFQLLTEFLTREWFPQVIEHGSVGQRRFGSLSHSCMNLIGEGEVCWQGTLQPASVVLAKAGAQPIDSHIRECLSITNGTSGDERKGLVKMLYCSNL